MWSSVEGGRCLFSFYKLFSYLRFYSSASKPPLFSLLSSSRSSVEPPLFSVFRPARGFPIFCPFAVVISVSILRSSHLSSVSVRTSVVLRFPSPRGIPIFCPFCGCNFSFHFAIFSPGFPADSLI
ncbi:hypothetical protein LXL04_001418 [Taraxacum kok-saghyz]